MITPDLLTFGLPKYKINTNTFFLHHQLQIQMRTEFKSLYCQITRMYH